MAETELQRRVASEIIAFIEAPDADEECSPEQFTQNVMALAERILRIPEIYDARSLPNEHSGETDYARGWNDCRRHAAMVV